MFYYSFIVTITIYCQLYRNRWQRAIFLLLITTLLLSTTLLCTRIEEKVIDALITILSIIFPLIAGFLTFGIDILKSIRMRIKMILIKSKEKKGVPVPDTCKNKVRNIENNFAKFIDIIISTFYLSFLLLIGLLVCLSFDYHFETPRINFQVKDFNLKKILESNWVPFSLKFFLNYTLVVFALNFLFITNTIVKHLKNDKYLNNE